MCACVFRVIRSDSGLINLLRNTKVTVEDSNQQSEYIFVVLGEGCITVSRTRAKPVVRTRVLPTQPPTPTVECLRQSL